MKNATWLFKTPDRKFKNSEARWIAIAHLSLIYISTINSGIKLPVYKSDEDGYLSKENDLEISGFCHSNTVCEQNLNGEIFEINPFPAKFQLITPDILHIDKKNRNVRVFKIKILQESVLRTISLYNELIHYLSEPINNWKSDLYYLMSHGHEKHHDWQGLSKFKSNIILWEDLFSIMSKTPVAGLIAESVGDYCAPPEKRP
jgi:hypothetical protein